MKNNILYDNFKNYDLDVLVESKSSHCPCCNGQVCDWHRKCEYYETINWMEIYICPKCNTTFKLENGA